jgi:hypothetical protein
MRVVREKEWRMRIGHIITGSVALIAMTVGTVAPAQARGYYGGGWGGYGHRHRDNFNFGDAIGIAALIGAVAVVAGSVSKDRATRQGTAADVRDAPRNDGYGPRADYAANGADDTHGYGGDSAEGSSGERDSVGRGSQDRRADADGPVNYGDSAPGGELKTTNAAEDACAVAARDEASADGGYAEIRDIAAPKAVSGGWDVDGRVERRAAYRDQSGQVRRFTCSIRDGRVSDVYVSKDVVT